MKHRVYDQADEMVMTIEVKDFKTKETHDFEVRPLGRDEMSKISSAYDGDNSAIMKAMFDREGDLAYVLDEVLVCTSGDTKFSTVNVYASTLVQVVNDVFGEQFAGLNKNADKKIQQKVERPEPVSHKAVEDGKQ